MNSSCAADWPDWRFSTAVVIGTGPGAAQVPLTEIQGQARCIAIKQSWRLAPWSDVLYGADRGWWIANLGVPEFKGLKVSPSPTACRLFGLRKVSLKTRDEIRTAVPGLLGGGHSGFQAVNLAVQLGASRIVLVGFDMRIDRAAHWHGDYHGIAKPDVGRVARWRASFDAAAPQFERLGVEVINATPGSALTAYPFRDLRHAIWDTR